MYERIQLCWVYLWRCLSVCVNYSCKMGIFWCSSTEQPNCCKTSLVFSTTPFAVLCRSKYCSRAWLGCLGSNALLGLLGKNNIRKCEQQLNWGENFVTFFTNMFRTVLLGKILLVEGFFSWQLWDIKFIHSYFNHYYSKSWNNEEVLLSDSAVGNGGFHTQHGPHFPRWVFKHIS